MKPKVKILQTLIVLLIIGFFCLGLFMGLGIKEKELEKIRAERDLLLKVVKNTEYL